MIKKVLVLAALAAVTSVCSAQVGTTASEGAKATAEKAKEAGDDTKAATTSGSTHYASKTKARMHKAKAHHHGRNAKDAAKDVPK